MKKHVLLFAGVALLAALPSFAEDTPKPPQTPLEIVAASKADEWVAIDPKDLLIMDLAPDAKGKKRRVIIQLMPAPFSQGWVGNIRKLATAHWWDGTAIVRVQDNYVTQWGDPNGDDPAKAKKLPDGLVAVPESAYSVDEIDIQLAAFGEKRTKETEAKWREALNSSSKSLPPNKAANPDIVLTQTASASNGWHERDAYARWVEIFKGWPIGSEGGQNADTRFWPLHCYGMVGVGRNLSPDTGTGAELYTVIGQAPRQLDRNIAVVGRVIEGIENLTSLPRGTGKLGFYETPEERVAIQSVRLVSELEDTDFPRYEYLNNKISLDHDGNLVAGSFVNYVNARANRKDDFYNIPAGGVDICNVPVPVRRKA